MQGFILRTQRVRDEDLLVFVLCKNALLKTYRFYGLRHSNILSGYKIDFSLEENVNFLPRLKEVLHLGFNFLMSRDKMLIWQDFIRLFYKHLRDVESCESFYFELLSECALRFERQNPKRVVLDAYAKLLNFEGRLDTRFSCFICDEKIHEDEIALARAFLSAHKACLPHCLSMSKKKLLKFYESFNSGLFSDDEVDALYMLILEGF